MSLSDGLGALKGTFDLFKKVLVLKFCYETCNVPACQKFATVAAMYPHITFAKVKVYQFPLLITEFDVHYAPTFVALFEDEVVGQRVDTSITGLLDMVERLSTINPTY